jgi:two-component sensor histidine kinase
MQFLSVFLLGAFAYWGKPRRRELARWTCAYVCVVIGALLISLRGQVPDLLSVILGNCLVLEAPAFILAGVRLIRGKETGWQVFVALAIASLAWFLYFHYARPSILARLVFYDSTYLVIFTAAAVEAAQASAGKFRTISRILGALLGVVAAIALARLAWNLATQGPSLLMSAGRVDSIIIVALGASMSLLAIGFLVFHLTMANQELEASASDRSLLLREMAHRTKNDLLLVDSLISIDQYKIADEDPGGSSRLAALRERIRCVAQAHEGLARSDEPGMVRLDEYLESIAQALQGHGGISVERDFQTATGPFSLAAPLGLVMNELATNAIKYAFPDGRSGRIELSLRIPSPDRGEAELEVRDDGIGSTWPPEKPGLGTAIVQSFVDKIAGTVSYSLEGGSVFRLSFPLATKPDIG